MAGTWNGTISFGLVNIPVSLSPAVRSKDIEFRMLHKEDNGRVGYQKICKICGKVLEPSEIVKGYEFEKGEYLPMEKEELEEAKGGKKGSKNLQISLFVEASEIDPNLFEKPYFVLPGKNASPLYILLREAIRQSGLVGIGKIELSSKEHLAALRVQDTAIMLNLMHFADELESPNEMELPGTATAPGPKELALANQLIGMLKGPFEPAEFRDTYRETLEEKIQEKLGTAPVAVAAKSGKQAQVIDLMARLKESLEKSEAPKGSHKGDSPKGDAHKAEAPGKRRKAG